MWEVLEEMYSLLQWKYDYHSTDFYEVCVWFTIFINNLHSEFRKNPTYELFV